MKSKILKIAWIFAASILLLAACTWMRGGYVTILKLTGIPLCMLAYAIAFFTMTAYFLKKYKTSLPVWLMIVTILIASSLPDIYARFIRPGGFQRSLVTLPDFAIRIAAVFLGLLYYKFSAKTGKIITLTSSLLLFLWCSYFGFDLWLHRINFGSFSGMVQSESIVPLNFYRSDGTTVQMPKLQHDYIILYFWSTKCGVCFRKFPAVQQLSDIYKNNPRVGVYGVHCWYEQFKENYTTGERVLSSEQYTFPSFSINQNAPILKEIEVTGYPTVVILNEQGKIAFRGSIEKAADLMSRLTE